MKKYSPKQGRIALISCLSLIALFLILGCGDYTTDGGLNAAGMGGANGGGGYGVTPGGAQDFEYVRTLVEQGTIPNPENIVTEGLLSEYDLPLEGPPPDQLLTLRAAVGFAGNTTVAGEGIYVQMGMASNIAAEEFHRPDLNLSVVLDRSGSMGGDKIEFAREALTYIINLLGPDDILSVNLFNESLTVLFEPTPVTNRDSLNAIVSRVAAGGSTNMEVGMVQGYNDVISSIENHPDKSRRVILITDALPNTGNYAPTTFQRIVAEGTELRIGLTAVGVGIDFDQTLIEFIATQHGANYYYMNSHDEAEQLFSTEFEFMVTPIAYEMQLTITPHLDTAGFEVHGFPGEDPTDLTMTVPTLFLSSRRGAMLFRFEPAMNDGVYLPASTDVVTIDLSYITVEEETVTDQLVASYGGPSISDLNEDSFDQPGIQLAVALTREASTLRAICASYFGIEGVEEDVELAQTHAQNLLDFLTEQNELLGEDVLSRELSLVESLLGILQQ